MVNQRKRRALLPHQVRRRASKLRRLTARVCRYLYLMYRQLLCWFTKLSIVTAGNISSLKAQILMLKDRGKGLVKNK